MKTALIGSLLACVVVGLVVYGRSQPTQLTHDQVTTRVACDDSGSIPKGSILVPDSVTKVCIEGRQALMIRCDRTLAILWDVPLPGHGPANPRPCADSSAAAASR